MGLFKYRRVSNSIFGNVANKIYQRLKLIFTSFELACPYDHYPPTRSIELVEVLFVSLNVSGNLSLPVLCVCFGKATLGTSVAVPEASIDEDGDFAISDR